MEHILGQDMFLHLIITQYIRILVNIEGHSFRVVPAMQTRPQAIHTKTKIPHAHHETVTDVIGTIAGKETSTLDQFREIQT